METEIVYSAENVPNLKAQMIFDGAAFVDIFVLDESNPKVTLESSTPFKYPTYTTKEIANLLSGKTYTAYEVSGYEKAEEKEIKTIPLINTLMNAFGIDYAEFTSSIKFMPQLFTADLKFTRPENVDQIIEWLIPMLGDMLGVDISALLGRDVTFEDINSILAKAFDMIYPMGEDEQRHVNEAIDDAISGLLGSSGLLGFIMPMWDAHNRFTLTDDSTEPDYFSGLLLTAAWALDPRLGLGDVVYGILSQTIDIVIGADPIARAQAEFDKGYSVEQLKELQYKLDNYPEIIAFANYWHVSVIFAGVVLLSMILVMYFAKKQKQFELSDCIEEEA